MDRQVGPSVTICVADKVRFAAILHIAQLAGLALE
jgi:hypothetical protein